MADQEEESPWNRLLGPFYSVASAAKLLEITEDELLGKVERLEILCTVAADGVKVFPAFQFLYGRPIEGLSEVLAVLNGGIDDPWTWGLWLTNQFSLDGGPRISNIERILEGDKEAVLIQAHHDAWAWSQ